MEKVSREQIELLVELQGKELEANKIEKIINEVPGKIEEMLSGLNTFEAAIDAQKTVLSELKTKYRSFDKDMQTHQSRIKKREEQLRAVKTNKEYQAILKEMGEMKGFISKIEDETLECLDKIDMAEKEVQERVNELKSEKETVDLNKSSLEDEAKESQKKLDQLNAERERLSKLIETELLKQYQFVKSIAGGVAIVEARNSVCLGCNMNIPPQMYNELHRGNEIKNCPHCYRMLYVI